MTILLRRLSPQAVQVVSSSSTACAADSVAVAGVEEPLQKKQPKSLRKKKVRFDNNNFEIFYEPQYGVITEEICQDVWWSKEEQEQSTRERRQIVKQFVHGGGGTEEDEDGDDSIDSGTSPCSLDSSIHSMNSVSSSASSEASQEPKKLLLHKHIYESQVCLTQVLKSNITRQYQNDLQDMEGLRGLESKVSKTTKIARMKHTTSVLAVSKLPANLLKMKSAQSSKRSQILAQVLAVLDRKECSS